LRRLKGELQRQARFPDASSQFQLPAGRGAEIEGETGHRVAQTLAADGAPIPPERILGKVVDCDNFQDARKFLLNGGEKGRQFGILTAGTYRINTALFAVITSAEAEFHGMAPHQLLLQRIEPDMVGIMTTLDGQSIEAGEIAGPVVF